MSLALVVVDGRERGLRVPLDRRKMFEVGSSAMADVTLDDPQVAGIHLKLYREDDRLTCFDVSGQGFSHNGRRTLKAVLAPGDRLQVGGQLLQLVDGDLAPAAITDPVTEMSPAPDFARAARPPAPPPPAPPAPPGRAVLLALKGNDAGKSFELTAKPTLLIGRGVAADITIWDIRASRVHCRIDHEGPAFRITDLDSSNGTYLNDERLRETRPLQPGDLVRIGSTVLRFERG